MVKIKLVPMMFFIANIITCNSQSEIDFQERRSKFASEGFGFSYTENEIESLNEFILNHGTPLKTMEKNIINRYNGNNDRIITLEYKNIIITFYVWEQKEAEIFPESRLESIISKANIKYLYNIKHGMTKKELNKIFGNTELIGDSIWLGSNNGNVVTIALNKNKVEYIVWNHSLE
jgi:hypothetical protein